MSTVKYCVFEYLYRDASNYKQFNAIRLTGTVSDETLKRLNASLDGDWFIPEQVGLDGLQFRFLDYGPVPTKSDHAWHEFVRLRPAVLPADMHIKGHGNLADLVQAFEDVDQWDVLRSKAVVAAC
jgi:hypothetical protein